MQTMFKNGQADKSPLQVWIISVYTGLNNSYRTCLCLWAPCSLYNMIQEGAVLYWAWDTLRWVILCLTHGWSVSDTLHQWSNHAVGEMRYGKANIRRAAHNLLFQDADLRRYYRLRNVPFLLLGWLFSAEPSAVVGCGCSFRQMICEISSCKVLWQCTSIWIYGISLGYYVEALWCGASYL